MTLVSLPGSPEAFFIYAETHLPDEQARTTTLEALQSCADSTARVTPSVATYVFRRSALSEALGRKRFPGCVSLESTELYLTNAGFRDHILTDEFRSALRKMYKEAKRLETRLFWIGATPPSDMLHNIFKSDPQARPIATVHSTLFNADVYARTRNEDAIILSLLCPVERGQGARALDHVRAAAALDTISFVAFFHPLAPDLLRIFLVAPVTARQPASRFAEAFEPFAEVIGARRGIGACQTHRSRPDLAAELRQALHSATADWDVTHEHYSGYVSHPAVRL